MCAISAAAVLVKCSQKYNQVVSCVFSSQEDGSSGYIEMQGGWTFLMCRESIILVSHIHKMHFQVIKNACKNVSDSLVGGS